MPVRYGGKPPRRKNKSGRSGRSRGASSVARSRVARSSRFGVRGARPSASAGQPIGAARFLISRQIAPRLSALETKLHGLGVPINKYMRFQSMQRFHIQPTSGHCFWGGVPHYLKQGTSQPQQYTVGANMTPSNCDLYDCARKCMETAGVGSTGVYIPNYDSMSLEKMIEMNQNSQDLGPDVAAFDGQQLSRSGIHGLGSGTHVRTFKVKNNAVQITMENVSSLDAFVEQYELTYTRPNMASIATASKRGIDVATGGYIPVQANKVNRVIGSPVDVINTYSTANSVVTNYPTCFDTRFGKPGSLAVFPEFAQTHQDIKKYGTRFAGQLLESYAGIANNHRFPAPFIVPFELAGASRNTDYVTANRSATIQELLCHPLNDPCKIWPPGVKNTTGFRLKRLPGLITLKPGASRQVMLPVNKEFSLDIDSFMRTVSQEIDNSVYVPIPTIERDVVDLPKSITVRFFRVRGDYTQKSTAAPTDADTDYQTGSCAVMFQVMRSFWMRSVYQFKSKEMSPIYEFDDTIAPALQEHVNDESDSVMVVDVAGDPHPL